MALRIIDFGSEDYMMMVDLRKKILRDPLGLSFSKDELDSEVNDILLGCFEEEKLEACCILSKIDDTTIRLRQMAVSDTLQGKGIGKALLNFAENIARDAGYKKLSMHARKWSIGFYEKLGYNTVGDEFIKITIPHVMMEKVL